MLFEFDNDKVLFIESAWMKWSGIYLTTYHTPVDSPLFFIFTLKTGVKLFSTFACAHDCIVISDIF
jgi:hypothetical protein